MKLTKILALASAAGVFALAPQLGNASIIGSINGIDFRDGSFAGCDSLTSCTVGITTVETIPAEALLWQDSLDGIGIRGNEPDEIDFEEQLMVGFDDGYTTQGVWITDLFEFVDGNDDPRGEVGKVELYDLTDSLLASFMFIGNDSDQANGEQYVDFLDEYLVGSAKFFTLGLDDEFPGGDNNDFSVAGFVGVPEPGSLALLGMGLVGFGLSRRRARS